jgi:hypothetical protein
VNYAKQGYDKPMNDTTDISTLPPNDWFKRFVYVSEGDYYFDVIERQE